MLAKRACEGAVRATARAVGPSLLYIISRVELAKDSRRRKNREKPKEPLPQEISPKTPTRSQPQIAMSWWPSFGSSSSADKGVSSAPAPAEPTTTFGASPSSPPPTPTTRVEDENAANYLRNASFSQPSPSSAPSAERIASASDVLGAGSTSAFDISKLHPMAQLGSDSIEYLMLEDDKKNNLPGSETALPSRGWSDDLCYGTGTTYLSGKLARLLAVAMCISVSFVCLTNLFWTYLGLALGGAWGIREGAGRKLAVSSARLRLNSILNSVTRRGSFMGNSAGVLGSLVRDTPLSWCLV